MHLKYRSRVSATRDGLAHLEAQVERLSRVIESGEDSPARERAEADISLSIKNIEQIFKEIRT